jgi:quercetin dioxygenase-like cupin family protein
MEGQEIQEHKTSRNAYLQCIKGKVTITIGGIEYPLKKGEIILLPKAILHGVKAWRKTILLLMK